MSTSLADDLLKSRTIADLRNLIQGLRHDAERKRSELQSMVGSQYHEFIQSADKIAKMDGESKMLTQCLLNFWVHHQQVIQNVNLLLGQKSQQEKHLLSIHMTSSSSIQKFIHELTPAAIWKDLSICDIYSASIKGLCALFLLDTGNMTQFSKYLLTEKSCTSLLNFEVTSKKKRDLQGIAFLMDTIISDARVFCLEDDSEDEEGLVEHKAKALAALSVLQRWKSVMTESSESKSIIETYLDCAKLKIDNLFATNLKQNQNGIHIEDGLLALVSLLQTIIIDIYMLFFHHTPLGNGTFVNGLVAFYQVQLATEVNFIFSNSSAMWEVSNLDHEEIKNQMKRSRIWIQDHIKIVTEGCSSLLHSLTSATQVAQLQQQVYSKCYSIASTNVKVCSDFLDMPPFIDIWNDACSELLIHKSGQHRRIITLGVANHESVDTALILWSTVFRTSFLHQVERLLHKACEDILQDVCDCLIDEFGSLGMAIQVDHRKGMEIHPAIDGNLDTSSFTSARIFVTADRIRSTFDSALGKLLEDVITPVQKSELILTRTLKKQSIDGKSCHSALSSQALMKALQGNCCKLVGQFLSLLRRVCDACQAFLQERGSLMWKTSQVRKKADKVTQIIRPEFERLLKDQFSSGIKLTGSVTSADHSREAMEDRVKLGLLLIGRIAWLMKIRKNAITAALTDTNSSLGSNGVVDSQIVRGDTISEDQFRSAFEIADTDGDGVLNKSEVIEALQALSLGDQYSKMFQDPILLSAHEHSSRDDDSGSSVTSLSYDEFVLVFGSPVFSWGIFQPIQRLNSALDHLISFSHMVWVLTATMHLANPLVPALSMQLGLGGRSAVVSLKASFQPKWIDLDASNEDSDSIESVKSAKEQIFVPSRISPPTFTLIHNVSKLANSFLVSMDTMQLSSHEVAGNTIDCESNGDENAMDGKTDWLGIFLQNQASKFSLCQIVVQLLYELALEQMYCSYGVIIEQCYQRKDQHKQEFLDDVAMQIMIDLMILNRLFLKSLPPNSNEKSYGGFSELVEKCKPLMDPITAELSEMSLRQVSSQIYDSTRLFMFVSSKTADASSDGQRKLTHHASGAGKESADQLISRLFAKSSNIPRCGLAPLALASNLSSHSKTSVNCQSLEKIDSQEQKPVVEDTKKTVKSNIIKWW